MRLRSAYNVIVIKRNEEFLDGNRESTPLKFLVVGREMTVEVRAYLDCRSANSELLARMPFLGLRLASWVWDSRLGLLEAERLLGAERVRASPGWEEERARLPEGIRVAGDTGTGILVRAERWRASEATDSASSLSGVRSFTTSPPKCTRLRGTAQRLALQW
jgi:hypothetical protein